jgi:hypothetical protein
LQPTNFLPKKKKYALSTINIRRGREGYSRQEQQSEAKKHRYIRFEVFTAVTVKNAVLWDMKTQFVLQRRHITSPLQSPAS